MPKTIVSWNLLIAVASNPRKTRTRALEASAMWQANRKTVTTAVARAEYRLGKKSAEKLGRGDWATRKNKNAAATPNTMGEFLSESRQDPPNSDGGSVEVPKKYSKVLKLSHRLPHARWSLYHETGQSRTRVCGEERRVARWVFAGADNSGHFRSAVLRDFSRRGQSRSK